MKSVRRILSAVLVITLLIPALALSEQISLCANCGHGEYYQKMHMTGGEYVDDRNGNTHTCITYYSLICDLCGNEVKMEPNQISEPHAYGDWEYWSSYASISSTQHCLYNCRIKVCRFCDHESPNEIISTSVTAHHSNGWPVEEECYDGSHRFYKRCDDCHEVYFFKSVACDGSNHPTVHKLPEEMEEI